MLYTYDVIYTADNKVEYIKATVGTRTIYHYAIYDNNAIIGWRSCTDNNIIVLEMI